MNRESLQSSREIEQRKGRGLIYMHMHTNTYKKEIYGKIR